MADTRNMPIDLENPLNDTPPSARSSASNNADNEQTETLFANFLDDETVVPPPDESPPLSPPPAPDAPPPPLSPLPAPPPSVSEPVKFSYNGNYYTLNELAQQGLLSEALQKATQYDTQRAVPASVPPAAESAPPPEPISARELQRQYQPMVDELTTVRSAIV